MDWTTLTSVLGWASVINGVFFVMGIVAVTAFRAPLVRMHAAMFGVDPEALPAIYLRGMAQYKMGAVLLNWVPYFALKIALSAN